VSSRGFTERKESTSGGLELRLIDVEWRRQGSSHGGGGRGEKKASLLHGTPFISGGGRGHGEGPQTG
jgi:hypothetical protein